MQIYVNTTIPGYTKYSSPITKAWDWANISRFWIISFWSIKKLNKKFLMNSENSFFTLLVQWAEYFRQQRSVQKCLRKLGRWRHDENRSNIYKLLWLQHHYIATERSKTEIFWLTVIFWPENTRCEINYFQKTKCAINCGTFTWIEGMKAVTSSHLI